MDDPGPDASAGPAMRRAGRAGSAAAIHAPRVAGGHAVGMDKARAADTASGGPPTRHAAWIWLRSPAVVAGLITLAVYGALVPWMARAWPRTGDEPHYLLAAHSLVVDGDLDLANNYARQDYHGFYTEFFLNPHVRVRADGMTALSHNLGLSLLIAPAYALGGLTGVLYFLTALGAVLAANAYGLAYDLTKNAPAAALGWAAIAFTPPVLWYAFLVYPELPGALILVLAVRALLRPASAGRPAWMVAGIGLLLAALPWLSSRFLPVYGLLVAWAAWRTVSLRSRTWLVAALLAVGGAASYGLFSLWLYGSAAPGAAYAGPTPLGVEKSFALLRAARGLTGWLVDNQRGLLITAPIYAVALWGAGLLAWQRPRAGAAVLAPLVLILATVAVWGGFWLGWEYSARFLVVALPLLGAGLAYLAATARLRVVLPFVALALAPSLLAGSVVIERPLQGLLSSPIAWLQARLDLAPIVPSMARFAYLPPGSEGVIGEQLSDAAGRQPEAAGQPNSPDAGAWGLMWQAPAGQSGPVLRHLDVPEFAFGWYTGRLALQAPGARADTPVAHIKIFAPGGGDYFARTVYGRDLPADGTPYTFSFHNPTYNGWGVTPTVLVSSTGQSELRLGTLVLEPDLFHSIGLAGLWLAGLAGLGALVVVVGARSAPRPASLTVWPAVTVLAATGALASLAWSAAPHARIYAAADGQRTTGSVVVDAAGYRGRAMQANPEAGDEAGKLSVTPPEIYGPGQYRIALSAQALPGRAAAAGQALSVRVLAAEVESVARRWDVAAADLPADGGYHTFEFDFENPRQQALTFIVDYAGKVGVRVDRLTVAPLP